MYKYYVLMLYTYILVHINNNKHTRPNKTGKYTCQIINIDFLIIVKSS